MNEPAGKVAPFIASDRSTWISGANSSLTEA